MSEIEESWQQCLDYIRDAEIVSEKEFNTWLKTLKTRVQDGILEVVAANVLVYDFVEKKYWGRIEKVIHEFLGDIPVKLAVSAMRPKIDLTKNTEVSVTEKSLDSLNAVKPQVHTAVVNESRADLSQIKTRNTSSSKNADRQIIEQLHESTKLVKENNFDTFVRGNSNQLAVAIGMHVTQEPGNRNHNPMFIYGGVGLGKTHLMQAIGNEMHRKNPKAKIRYLHANDYIQDVVKASMSNGFDAFKRYYNNLDLLLMD